MKFNIFSKKKKKDKGASIQATDFLNPRDGNLDDLKGDDNIKISGRKLETLAYYLKHGYSKKTKEKILKDCKIKDSNLNNVNCELRRLGFITVDARNENKNHVDPKLSDFIKYMVDNKGKYVLIKVT